MYKTVNWNTGLAAERARFNLKLKTKKIKSVKRQAASNKPQAASRKPQGGGGGELAQASSLKKNATCD